MFLFRAVLFTILAALHAPVFAQGPQGILTACGLTLDDLSPLTNSTTRLSGYPQVMPAGGSQTLPNAGTNELIILRWVESAQRAGGSCTIRTVARSYAGAWEGVRPDPADLNCVGSTCSIDTTLAPPLPQGMAGMNTALGAYVLIGYTRANGMLSNAEAASRFLAQATFGPTRADIAQLLGVLDPDAPADNTLTRYTNWIENQRSLPPTFLREHFRERISTRLRGDPAIVGRTNKPCDIGSRWNSYAFIDHDEDSIMTVTRVGSGAGSCYYELTINGVVMTHVPATFAEENCTDALSAERLYRVCDVQEPTPFSYRIDPHLSLLPVTSADPQLADRCSGNNEVETVHPVVWFNAPTAAVEVYTNASDITLAPVEAVLGSYVVTSRSATCTGVSQTGVSFMSVPGANGTEYYRLDARRTLIENSLENPTDITDPEWAGACPDVDRTFVSEETCVLLEASATACSSATFVAGQSITLDEATIRFWFTENARYVYTIQNLRLDDTGERVDPPCEAGEVSRWIRTSTSACTSAWNNEVAANAIRAALNEPDANPEIVDVTVADFGDCDTAESTKGRSVTVDGQCWTHSHPNERDIYDFTTWRAQHEGGPARIQMWAEAGLTYLNFPASHAMSRWYDNFDAQRYGYHPRVGRLGDVIEFTDLPVEMQTDEMGSRVGATKAPSTQGFLRCGSRGEGASRPEIGNRFRGTAYSQQGLDRITEDDMPQTYTWDTVVLQADDQLRHKVAWALSQIVVAQSIEDDDGNGERMLSFYDIFVQHAFGSYRDILREVSTHPVMGRYLTFHNNRAFATSGTFPDENYAREVMQLFSIGVFELDDGGTETRTADGDFILTYSNTDIENGARLWTGWNRRPRRENILLFERTSENFIDPMFVRVVDRDRFAKTTVGGDYLGDGYPLCADLPAQHFLQQGARYVLTGEFSALGQFYDELAAQPGSVARDHFTLTPTSNSGLYTELCGVTSGPCVFRGAVHLSGDVTCTGEVECNVDTLRVVRVVSSSGQTAYYKYEEPACTYLSFFDDGQLIRNSNIRQCADPSLALQAGVACCDADSPSVVLSNSTAECKYLAEPMTYATAMQRCADIHPNGVVCGLDAGTMVRLDPFRDSESSAYREPSLPSDVTLISNGPAEEWGTVSGIPRWRLPIRDTARDTGGVTGPVVLLGTRPDNSVERYTVNIIDDWSNGGYMYFRLTTTTAEYDDNGYGLAQLDVFNNLFPNGTNFTVDGMGYGPDPTGELGQHPRWAQFCAAWQYQWTPDRCEMEVEVDSVGRVSLLDPIGAAWLSGASSNHLRWLRAGSGNKFQVKWNDAAGTPPTADQQFPRIGADGFCDTLGCTNTSRNTCVCSISVENVAAYTDPANVPRANEIRENLMIGAFMPSTATHTLCTSCNAEPSVQVWTLGSSATPTVLDEATIFVLSDLPYSGLRSTRSIFKNVVSTVFVGQDGDVEIALMPTSCMNSSEFQTAPRSDGEPVYWCENVYQGGTGREWVSQGQAEGAWVSVSFEGGAEVTLNRVRIGNRCGTDRRAERIELSFSDGSTQIVTMANNTRCELENFEINEVTTTFVNFTILSAYTNVTTNLGFREIEFYGPSGGANGQVDTNRFNFRNPPHFVPNEGAYGRNSPESSSRYEVYGWNYYEDKAMQETDAGLDRLLEHHNTPVMIAMQLIQKLVTSNPSPRYVQTCAEAFRSGEYGTMTFSGEFADLGATVACVLLDREARTPILDLDDNHGKLQESLLKVVHMMRSMELDLLPGREVTLEWMGGRIAQGAFQYPSVFNFFSPFYEPPGPVADAGLVAPEAMILAAPEMVNYFNGMDSLINYGLTSCSRGFGDNDDQTNKRDGCRSTTLDETANGYLSWMLPPALLDVEIVPDGECLASAMISPNPSRGCYSAWDGQTTEWITDGGSGRNSWLELAFATPQTVDTMKLQNRCGNVLYNNDVMATFSDGTVVNVTMWDNCTMMEFPLGSTITTEWLRLDVLTVGNQTSTSNGFREVELLLGNVSADAPVECSASSENNVRRSRTCDLRGMTGNRTDWYIVGNGSVGDWMESTFTSPQEIGRVSIAFRCGAQRPRDLMLTFSDGSSWSITMENECEPLPVPIPPVTTTSVRATVVSLYTEEESACCDCGRYMRRYLRTTAPTELPCEDYQPDEPNEMRFWNNRRKDVVVDMLALLLTPGRASDLELAVIADAYERERTTDAGLKKALRLFMLSSSFHINADPKPLELPRVPYMPPASQGRRYKAIVTIMLGGGADSFNMLVPHTCSNDLVAEYGQIRGAANTLAPNTLLQISPSAADPPQPCDVFGLHPSFTFVQSEYNSGNAILFANMGGMVEPILTYEEYRNRNRLGLKTPTGNFGHNGMQRNIQSMVANDHLAKGVIGRAAGILANDMSYKTGLYSLNGQVKILEGSITPSIVSSSSGVVRYQGLPSVEADLNLLHSREHGSIFAETFSQILSESIESTETLGILLEGKTTVTDESLFGGDEGGGSLGSSLREIAKLIRVDNEDLEMERAGYFATQGGYDTHGTFDMAARYDDLDRALELFVNELRAQGVYENVAIQLISDFGRTLTNNGQGTDHAWGGNYLLLGGDVRGGRILGQFPESLEEDNVLDMGRGRLLPTTPFESIWNAHMQWWGITEQGQLDFVLPNRVNFPQEFSLMTGALWNACEIYYNTDCIVASDGILPPTSPSIAASGSGASEGGVDGSGVDQPTSAPCVGPLFALLALAL